MIASNVHPTHWRFFSGKTLTTQRWLVGAWLFAAFLTASAATPPAEVILTVTEPYAELHTGPGRGYPVFDIAKKNTRLTLFYRQTDWFKVKTDEGKIGWVLRTDIEQSLAAVSFAKTTRDRVFDEYLHDRFDIGLAAGSFDGDLVLTMRTRYAWRPSFAGELSLAQISGTYNTSYVYSAQLLTQPRRFGRVTPFLAFGVGWLNDTPRATLVDRNDTWSPTGIVGIGVQYQLTPNVSLRADYHSYTVFVDSNRTLDFNEYNAGFAFLF